jgi:hypothetical protein
LFCIITAASNTQHGELLNQQSKKKALPTFTSFRTSWSVSILDVQLKMIGGILVA